MGALMELPSSMLVGAEFSEYLVDTEERAKVLPVSAYRDTVQRMFNGELAEEVSYLPWSSTHEKVQFRRGEVSTWIGSNGSGKSMLVGFALLGLRMQGEKSCVMSFEMKPTRTLQRMAKQFSRGPAPTESTVGRMFDWLDGSMWFYDQQGTVHPRNVYAVAKYAADKLGCRHVVIDSLMKIVRGDDDYNAQKDAVDELTAIARDYDVHIHLVHHIRKPADDGHIPTKFDAKGTGGIIDQVDNSFVVWRNKPKERLLQKCAGDLSILSDKERDQAERPDVLLVCDKARNGEWEGSIPLWFDSRSQQYCDNAQRRLVEFG